MSVVDFAPGQGGREPRGSASGSAVEFDRTPPQDIEAEQCVLGGMLLSKDAIADVVEVVRPGDFYRPAHQTIYDTVLDLYGRGEPADPVTVAAELTRRGEIGRAGGAPYLHTLVATVPTAANAGYYADIVRERAILRRLVEAGTRIVQLGYGAAEGAGGEVDDIVDRAQAAVYEVTERRTSEDYVRLEELLHPVYEEIEAIGSRGGVMAGVPTGFRDLDELTNGLHPGQLIVIAARPAVGKALALDTRLPTPTGWTTMGDVQVGDLLLGADGRPTRVVAVTEVLAGRPCFEVEFNDGSVLVADQLHQWLTDTRASRQSAQAAAVRYNRYRNQRTFAAVRTTKQIADTLRCDGVADQRLNHSVANTRPLQLPQEKLAVPPYTLGAWLGDGHSAAARLTTCDPDILLLIEADGIETVPSGPHVYSLKLPDHRVAPQERSCLVCGQTFIPRTTEVLTCGRTCGPRLRRVASRGPAPTCRRCGGPAVTGYVWCQSCEDHHGSLQAELRGLGILGNKHIPRQYLRASEEQRRSLLAGLLDTDGTVTNGGCAQFTTTSAQLAEDVRELIHSLGYRCGMSRKRVRGCTEASSTAFTITFAPDDSDVFRLERKRLLHKERRGRPRAHLRFIRAVRPVASVPVRCVQVDAADHLYLAGDAMIPTHNSTLALDVVRAASIGHNMTSAMFSLEMSRSEITMRLLSAEARVPLHHMRTGRMSDDDWTKLARRIGDLADAPLFIDDSPNLSMMEIRAKARRLRQRNQLSLVVVDYLQLMSSARRVENRQQEVAEMSRSLKLLAKELDVPVIAISQLNRSPEQRAGGKPQLSDLRESGCLTAETRLLRADTNAEASLGELLAGGARDVPVWSLDERLKLVPRTMTHVFSNGVKEVFRLRLASGRQVHATANHPFLTFDGWQSLGELTAGDRLAAPRHVPPPLDIESWDEDEVLLLAHLIGDGSVVRHQPVRYASVDEENLAAVSEAAERRFGITAVRDNYPAARCTSLRLPAPHHLTRGRPNPIAAWMDELGLFGLRSYEKFVPAGVNALPKTQVGLFLRHLWATDGCVHWDARHHTGRIYYATSSRRLADDVARLLLRFNIFTRTKTVRKAGYRDNYHVHITGADNQLRFCEEIGVHGQRGAACRRLIDELRPVRANANLDTIPVAIWDRVRATLSEQRITHRQFAARMGPAFCGSTQWRHAPSRARMAAVAAVLDDADLEVLATNDVYWDTVVSIESIGEQEVFDATVLGNHNFVADGIAAHNSIEQDADVVILLYREDMFEKESARAGEADLIVAKHRNGPTATVTVAFQGHYSRFVDMAPL